MGLTQKLGTIPLAILTDASNNVGIGGAASGSYKFQVTGTGNFTGALTVGSSITASARVSGITQNTLEQFNAGGLTAFSNGNAFKYIQIGYDNTGNYGWIQALEQGTAYRNLILNAAGGNVGIGTSSPSAVSTYTVLEVAGPNTSTGGMIRTKISDGSIIGKLYSNSTGVWLSSETSHPLILETANTERMRITAAGELFFNTNYTGYRVIIGGSTGIRNVILTNGDSEGFAGGTTSMYVGKQSSTNRSINAAGTINASGADYAEYMKKLNADLNFAKGDIIGVDKNGLLTDIFADSISFVVKSTDPSYVGGDNWFNDEIAPEKTEGQTEEEFNEIFSKWDLKYQEARKWIDRIAFSGQVPCNVYNAKEGDYIIPINNNGKISGQSVTKPTFEQYQIAVGKVWKIMEDGRAWVAVKIG